MFRKNQRHLQPFLITNVNDLPEKHRKRLETSWAGVFYRETFSGSMKAPLRCYSVSSFSAQCSGQCPGRIGKFEIPL